MSAESDLPNVEALLAGTLALMSAWAHPCPDAKVDATTLRDVLRKKIVSNLFFLQHHPLLSEHMRQVVCNLHRQWLLDCATCAALSPRPPSPPPSDRGVLH